MAEDSISLVILRAANELHAGKLRLAGFLKGSRSREMVRSGLHLKRGYGALLWKSIDAIKEYIDQLQQHQLLMTKRMEGPYPYYILMLTAAGKEALQNNVGVKLQERKPVELVKRSDTLDLTRSLIHQGKSPADIAEHRQLALTTIYDHLYRLVALGELTAKEFLPGETIQLVRKAKREAGTRFSLTEVKALLPEHISYGQIRCILAERSR